MTACQLLGYATTPGQTQHVDMVVAELTEFDLDEEAYDWLLDVEQQAGVGTGIPASGN